MDRFFLKPANPEILVPIPGTNTHLPAEGKEVPKTSYWLRRLKDGDVLEGTAKAAAKPKVAEPPRKEG